MDKLKPYLPWIFRAVGLVLVASLAWAWNSARNDRNEMNRLLEAERLKTANLLVEVQKTKADMAQQEHDLLMSNADLENEVQRLKDELGKKPKIVEIIKWKTKEVPVEGPPVAIPCPDGTTVACHFPPGSTGHVEADELTYKTAEGNLVIVGKAGCWRDTPAPPARLFTSTFSAKLSEASILQEKPLTLPGWGGGLRASVSNLGWELGPVLAFPALPFLFSTQVELSLDFTVGTPWVYKPEVPAVSAQIGGSAVLRGR